MISIGSEIRYIVAKPNTSVFILCAEVIRIVRELDYLEVEVIKCKADDEGWIPFVFGEYYTMTMADFKLNYRVAKNKAQMLAMII